MTDSEPTGPFFDQKQLLEKITELVPSIIYVFNQQNQSNEYTNEALGRMLGYSAQEVQELGDALLPTLCAPEDLLKIASHFEYLKSAQDGEITALEYRVRRKSGDWAWLLSHDTVFERAEDGSVLRHIGVAADITAQKTAEAAALAGWREAQAQAERLNAVLTTVNSAIIGLDAAKNVISLNPIARHVLGGVSAAPPFPWPEAIKFLRAEDLKPLDASADPVNRALAGAPINNETHLMTRAGSADGARYMRVSTAVVAGDDAPAVGFEKALRAVIVLDDITEQERNRQQMERHGRLDALGQLTGGISHDFNNLLTTLLYTVELAKADASTEDARALLDTAIASIDRGKDLTDRLLAFAKAAPANVRSQRVSDVLTEFERLARPTIEDSISLELDAGEPGLAASCDGSQLDAALLNLVLNSRDAMLASGRGDLIRIAARAVEGPQWPIAGDTAHTVAFSSRDRFEQRGDASGPPVRSVEISVTDNGPGMESAVLRRATDPFFTTKRQRKGTGLGLSMVYGFVMQAGGEMRIYSEPGVGTTVRLVLPRADERKPAQRTPPAPPPRGAGERILLVEDEKQLLSLMRRVLSDLGYVVSTAENGEEAVALLTTANPFDLLITDVVMPKMGGFELAAQVRARFPELPILFMSGYIGFSSEEAGVASAEVLQKPCPPQELATAVRTALDAARS